MMMNDLEFLFRSITELMRLALDEAAAALAENNVPVGAVLRLNDGSLFRDHNRMTSHGSNLLHAELLVLQAALLASGSRWLHDSILAVSMEPCPMCAGAIQLARVPWIAYAAPDPRMGAAGSRFHILGHHALNHRPIIVSGIAEPSSRHLLQQFFQSQRTNISTQAVPSEPTIPLRRLQP